jgi:hypothetical protein
MGDARSIGRGAAGSRCCGAGRANGPLLMWVEHDRWAILGAPAARLSALSSRQREEHTATSAERMRALRERERRGLRRLTIGVSEDDLRAISERG